MNPILVIVSAAFILRKVEGNQSVFSLSPPPFYLGTLFKIPRGIKGGF
jgi:hypothetical protein